MCGICGEVTFDGSAAGGCIAAMTERMHPRGPDAGGAFMQDRVAFGHRRLSIIDLAAASQQPMVDPQLGLAIVFNGCIYNYRQLRSELMAKGYRFFSEGDTEVILKAYAEWGPRCVERFYGMFAFAIWERNSGRVVLARDRLGIKPLYYTERPGRFRFASTLPALLAAGDVDTSIDPAALHHYMSLHAVVPAPLTILKGVKKLPAATICTIEPDGRRREETYWQLKVGTRPEDRGLTEADWQDAIRFTFGRAVERRRVADVPVGVLLSGGLDSSIIVALLAAQGQNDLRTFSVGFETVGELKGDEFYYSNLIAQRFGTRHERIAVDSSRAIDALPGTIAAMSEPMMSHDAVGFYLLSQQVAKHVKVAQSGQGADEIFGGYHWYPTLMQSNDPAADYARVYFDRDHDEMGEALSPALMNGDYSREFVENFFDSCRSTRAIDKTLQLDAQIMMVDDPVKRVDNMAMAWGLETRVPFLDHEVVELAARIPAELKVRDGGKYILKQASPRPRSRRGDRPAEGLFPGAGAEISARAVLRFCPRRARRPGGAPARRVQPRLCRSAVGRSRRRTDAQGPLKTLANRSSRVLAANPTSRKQDLTMEFRFDPHERRFRIRTLVPPEQARIFAPDDLFQFGIEEEYFLSDAQTLQVPKETPEALFQLADCGDAGRIGREFLQAQIEVATEPHSEIGDARTELKRLRQNVAAAAAAHGLTILACGTHPSALWPEAVQSPKDRYTHVMDVLQMIGQRNMLCGMHVHVEFPDPARRVDVMTRMLPYLPLFIALSTSSPFWQGRATGLKGYRLAAYDELPRTGLPELFRGNGDYDEYVAAMMRSGAIKDASHLWWAIRPSLKYPTLELRAPDCCTRLDDAIAIAALYRVLARHLYVDTGHNAGLSVVDRSIAVENKWRAQRYGVGGTFASRSGAVAVGEMLERVLDLVAADAAALGCVAEVEHCRKIAAEGTSAEAQVKIFTENEHEGVDIALNKVARWIRDTTLVA